MNKVKRLVRFLFDRFYALLVLILTVGMYSIAAIQGSLLEAIWWTIVMSLSFGLFAYVVVGLARLEAWSRG